DVLEHPFPDHHPFVAADLTFDDELPVLMTHKDAVKCRLLASARMWYVPVAARFADAEARELLERVVRSLAPQRRSPAGQCEADGYSSAGDTRVSHLQGSAQVSTGCAGAGLPPGSAGLPHSRRCPCDAGRGGTATVGG